MSKILGYKILVAQYNDKESIKILNSDILRLLETGWEPYGPHILEHSTVSAGGDTSQCREGLVVITQAMVKYE